ncbi:Uncharacterised protein [Flavonifractor plautii]|uniref:Uncharacterized protein n=1 Tax=Flavonifractor plautii TaxID=292800 RepID=A0A174W8V1_FLAPL|nr:Uncharacterised protein [Flavonifractor plautii]
MSTVAKVATAVLGPSGWGMPAERRVLSKMLELKTKEEAITAAVFGSWADSPSTYTRRATNWARSLRWGGA